MRPTATVFALAALLATVAPTVAAERGDDADRKSKNGHLEATISGVDVVVDYGRPQVRDREIWGALVPFDKVWRTGANEATTVTFAAPVQIGGEDLEAGTYALFTIPGEDKWVVIFNRQAEQWGAYDYDAGQDVLRVEVTPEAAEMTEEMTFVSQDGSLVLLWEKLAVPIAVSAAG